MNRKQKLCAILCALMFVLQLSGCGGKADNVPADAVPAEQQTAEQQNAQESSKPQKQEAQVTPLEMTDAQGNRLTGTETRYADGSAESVYEEVAAGGAEASVHKYSVPMVDGSFRLYAVRESDTLVEEYIDVCDENGIPVEKGIIAICASFKENAPKDEEGWYAQDVNYNNRSFRYRQITTDNEDGSVLKTTQIWEYKRGETIPELSWTCYDTVSVAEYEGTTVETNAMFNVHEDGTREEGAVIEKISDHGGEHLEFAAFDASFPERNIGASIVKTDDGEIVIRGVASKEGYIQLVDNAVDGSSTQVLKYQFDAEEQLIALECRIYEGNLAGSVINTAKPAKEYQVLYLNSLVYGTGREIME